MRKLAPQLALTTLLLGACGGLLEPAAAVVRGEKITVHEVQAAVDEFRRSPEFDRLAQGGDAQALVREFEQNYLSQAIRRAVLQPEATSLGLEVTRREVTRELELIRGEFPSEGAFLEALKEQGLSLDQLEILVQDRLLEDEVRAEITADVVPTEDELRTYYREHREDFTDTLAQHILVTERPLAQRIAARLQALKGDAQTKLFARLASRHSQDRSTKDAAGDLGFYSPGDFVVPFERAATRLRIDEVSDPVRTEFGWHVIRVNDRVARGFVSVKEELEDIVGGPREDEAWDEWLAEVYDAAEVEVNPRYGEFDADTKIVVDPAPEDIPGVHAPSPSPT